MDLTPRRQGDLGEASDIEWLTGQGAEIAVPLFSSTDWDVIADFGDGLKRVQVKTSRRLRNNRWEVMLCTRGGNQSWNGVAKTFSAERCDFLFVLVADGRRWFIPASAIEGGHGVLLGGPKYACFEIDPGRAFAAPIAA